MSTVRKWTALFNIFLMEGLAYRASIFIWVLTDVVPACIMPLMWLAAYGGRPEIAGYSPNQMVTYYIVMVFLTNIIVSHLMWDIAWQIKEGQFSVFLVRPVGVFVHYFMQNLSWRVVRGVVFLPLFLALVFAYREYVQLGHLYLGWELWVAVFLGHTLSFVFVFAMAMLALFLQEARNVFELYYIPMLFLSGQIAPLGALPRWAEALGYAFPFRFTSAFATEIAVGKVTPAQSHAQIGLQVLWIGISALLGYLLFKKGIRHYTGVGM